MSSSPQYTYEVGRKFYADGSPRMFAGNTIICFVDPEGPLGRAAQALQADLRGQAFGHKFAPLPPSSFHMTVMELLCDQARSPERWSAELALDTPLADTDTFFLERVPAVAPPAAIRMWAAGLSHRVGLLIDMQPADEAINAALRGYRDAIAAATGVRAPGHEGYGFHISLAYRLIQLDADEEHALAGFCAGWAARLRDVGSELALEPPQLTFFDDMFRFVPAEQRHELKSR